MITLIMTMTNLMRMEIILSQLYSERVMLIDKSSKFTLSTIIRRISLMIILPGGRNCSEERQKDGSRVRDDFDQDDDFDAD